MTCHNNDWFDYLNDILSFRVIEVAWTPYTLYPILVISLSFSFYSYICGIELATHYDKSSFNMVPFCIYFYFVV